jgi:GGDEF domain-containing protein
MKKVKIKRTDIDDIKDSYGIDAADELMKMLSEELAKSIDKEILKGLGLEDRKSKRKSRINKILNSLNNSR